MIWTMKQEIAKPLMRRANTIARTSTEEALRPPREDSRHSQEEYRVEIVNDVSEFLSLGDAWNRLAKKFQSPLLSHEWFAACARAFCPPTKLSVIVVRTAYEIIAAAPLALVHADGIERLELLGASLLREPCGFIYRDEESLQRLLSAIHAIRKPMVVGRLSLNSLESLSLKERMRLPFVFTLKEPSWAPSITIASSWEEFEKGISASRRSSLRRARRHAEEFGKVEFEITAPKEADVDNHLEEIFRVEAAGWKERNGTSMQSIQELKRFFSLYAHIAACQGILRTCYMRINGNAVAAQLAVEYAERFWTFKIGYDEAFARCSPGTLLMHEAIRSAFDRRLKSFEFLGNDEPWIRIWTDNIYSFITYRIYPWTIDGSLALGQDMSIRLLRRFKAWQKRMNARSAEHHPH